MSDNRRFVWYRQRKKCGFDDRETWSLDYTIAKFVLPRLIRFKEVNNGRPNNLTWDEWNKILDKMIYSINAVVHEWDHNPEQTSGSTLKKHYRKTHEGLILFGKYFRHLWW
jgi:hypothetical protein